MASPLLELTHPFLHYIKSDSLLTLKAPITIRHLLNWFRSLLVKQCRPRLDCSDAVWFVSLLIASKMALSHWSWNVGLFWKPFRSPPKAICIVVSYKTHALTITVGSPGGYVPPILFIWGLISWKPFRSPPLTCIILLLLIIRCVPWHWQQVLLGSPSYVDKYLGNFIS